MADDVKVEEKKVEQKVEEKKVEEKKVEEKVEAKVALTEKKVEEIDTLFSNEDGDKKVDGKDTKSETLTIDVPEDLKEVIDAKSVTVYTTKAKELGMSQKQLSELVSAHFDVVRKQVSSVEAEHRANVDEWKNIIKSDPEMGGAKLKESMTLVQRGALALGGQALVKFLRESDLGFAPELFRAFRAAGLSASEDRLGEFGQKPSREKVVSTEEKRLRAKFGATIASMEKDTTTRQ